MKDIDNMFNNMGCRKCKCGHWNFSHIFPSFTGFFMQNLTGKSRYGRCKEIGIGCECVKFDGEIHVSILSRIAYSSVVAWFGFAVPYLILRMIL